MMKRVFVWLLLAAVLVGIHGATAMAIPAFRAEFESYYKAKDDIATTDTEKALAEKVAAAKCNVCHVPGEKKEVNNPYGLMLKELLDKDNFSATRRKEEAAKVAEEIQAALKAVEGKEAPCGKTVGECLQAGDLPVPLPPE